MNCRNSSTPSLRTWGWLKAGLFGAALALFGTTQAQITVPGSHASLAAAFTAINGGSFTGAVTIDITASYTEPAGSAVLNSSGAGLASYTSVTIRPTVPGIVISGSTVTGRGIIELNGADNVTINGDAPGGGANDRDLTITNTAANTVTYTMCVRVAVATTVITSADNVVIRNLIVNGSASGRNIAAATSTTGTENLGYGIYCGGGASTVSNTTAPSAISSATTTAGSGATMANLIISNNAVNSCARGIAVQGSAQTVVNNLTVTDNVIGSATPGNTTTVYSMGMTLQGFTAATVTGNTVQNIESYVGTGIRGIDIGSISATGINALVARNTVNRVNNQNVGTFGAYGINIQAQNNQTIQNNCVRDVLNSQTAGTGAFSTTFGAFGIRVSAGTGHKVLHNTVNLTAAIPGSTNTNLVACLAIVNTSQTGMDVRNNIFSCPLTGGNPTLNQDAFVCIWLPSGATSAMNLTLNNNALYQGSLAYSGIGQAGTTGGTNFYTAANFNPGATSPAANMRAYTSTLSAAGTNDNASFATTAAAPLIACGVDLTNPIASALNGTGASGTGVADDLTGDLRGTPPDIGADEFNLSACGSANGGTITPNTQIKCAGQTATMTAAGADAGAGITYLWEVSPTGGGAGFVAVSGGSGATTTSYTTAALTAGTYYYRLHVTCSNGPINGFSNELTVTVNPTPTASASSNSPACVGQPLQLTGTTDIGTTFSWTGPLSYTSSSQSPLVSASATAGMAGTYTFTATLGSCTSAPSNTVVVVNPTPTISVNPPSAALCPAGSVILTAQGPGPAPLATVLSSLNSNAASIQSSFPTPAGFALDGVGGVNGTSISDGGCDMYDSPGNQLNTNLAAGLTYSDNTIVANANLGAGGQYFTRFIAGGACTGGTAALFFWAGDINGLTSLGITGDPGADGSGTQNITSFPITANGLSYTAFVKRLFGAGDPSINHIFLIPTPNGVTQTMGASTTTCNQTLSNLTGVTRFYYLLFAGAGGAQYNDVQMTAVAQAFANAIPSAPQTFPGTVSWSPNGETTPAITASAAGTYTVTGTIGGCSAQASSTVTVASTFSSVTITPAAPAYCTGGSVLLTATPNDGAAPYTYQWFTPSAVAAGTAQTQVANQPGVWTVNITDNCGNPVNGTASPTVVENPVPVATAGSNSPVCTGNPLNLTGSSDVMGSTFSWTGPNAYANGTQSPQVSASATLAMAGTYVLTATANGCTSAPSNAVVVVNQSPSLASTTATPGTICPGGSSQLLVTPTPPPAYCAIGPITSGLCANGDEWISALTFGSINTSGVTCAQSLPVGYIDFTSSSTALTAGSPTNALSATISSYFTGDQMRVWFDWNKDGDFTDANEEYTPGTLSSGAVSMNIAVPAGAFNGSTRMRVRLTYTGTIVSCGTAAYGVVHDYTVNVSGGVDQYTYSWDNPGTLNNANIANPMATIMTEATTINYTVTVSSNGCSVQGSASVTTPTVNDGDPCTLDQCAGNGNVTHTFQDADGDLICDANDDCPNLAGEQGDACDDGNANTGGDVITAGCVCQGIANDCNGVPGGPDMPGTPCNDGNPNTGADTWQANCTCVGQPFDCEGTPGGTELPGTGCDDGNASTGWDPLESTCRHASLSIL